MAQKFQQAERRHVYTTPKSFLELLKLYNVLLTSKREAQEAAIERLASGLQKLRDTKAREVAPRSTVFSTDLPCGST